MTSAYPIPTDVLEDRIRALALELGGWPSQRRVMRECRVGAPRANEALAALRESGFDPTTPARAQSVAGPALSVVPDLTDEDSHPNPDADPHPSPNAGPDAEPGLASDPDREARTTAADPDSGTPTDGDDKAGTERTQQRAETHSDQEGTTGASDVTAGAVSRAGEAAEDGPVSPVADTPTRSGRRVPRWPLLLIALGAFVAIWGGWVGLGEMAGFGPIRLLPGIADDFVINSAITLPIGVEAYAAFALRAWLADASADLSGAARRFACWSSLGALALGVAGQVAYHLMVAAGITVAPWPITAFVSALPVIVLGLAAILAHLIHRPDQPADTGQ